jgi:hypothetical protein
MIVTSTTSQNGKEEGKNTTLNCYYIIFALWHGYYSPQVTHHDGLSLMTHPQAP